MKYFLGLFMLLLLSLPSLSGAMTPIDIAYSDGQLTAKKGHYLVDPSNQRRFNELPSLLSTEWLDIEQDNPAHGFTKDAYWLQFEVTNSSEVAQGFVEVAYPQHDKIDFYVQTDDHLEIYQLGDLILFSDRPVDHRHFVVPLDVQKNQLVIVTIRVSTAGTMQIPVKFWSLKDFIGFQSVNLVQHGIYYGFLIVMIIYNLFIYSYIREVRYLQYVCFVSSVLFFSLSLNGFGYEFLWPERPQFNRYAVLVSLCMTLLFGSMFCKSFLDLKKRAKNIAFLMSCIVFFAAASIPLIFVVPYNILCLFLVVLAFIFSATGLLAGFKCSFLGDRSAQLFTLAWCSSYVGGILLALNKLGFIEPNSITNNAFQIGTALEVVLLSFALAEYIAQQRRDNQAAQEEVSRLEIISEQERIKNQKISAQNELIKQAHDEAEQRSQDVSDLLNNSGQGFIAFGSDLIIGSEYSRACIEFLKCEPKGKKATDLVYALEQTPEREFFENSIRQILIETDDFRRDMILSLLPIHFELHGRCLKAEYKPLTSSRLMMIFTDISSEINLQQQVQIEHARLSMIVSAFLEQCELIEVIEGFEHFLERYDSSIADVDLKDLYRSIHTFKGLFNQYDFINLPSILHEVENQLSKKPAKFDLPTQKIREALDSDLDIIVEVIGHDFVKSKIFTQVSNSLLEKIEFTAADLIAAPQGEVREGKLAQLLKELNFIFKVDLKQLFSPVIRGTYKLAEKLDKKVNIALISDDIKVYRDDYKDLINSVVHIFRNAVDHGIESIEDRDENEKNEEGLIQCRLSVKERELIIQISDDGKGIDPVVLRRKLEEKNLCTSSELQNMSDHVVMQMVLMDDVSTQNVITDISGRGVGLAATKAEVIKLGGSIDVSSVVGEGCQFTIRLPHILPNA